MKRTMRWAAFFLIILITVTLIACGRSKTGVEEVTASESAETTESNMSPAYSKAIEDRRAEYEKTGEYQKVTYAIYTWTGSPIGIERIQEAMNKILRKKLCLEIELLAMDFSSYGQDVHLKLTNNDEQIDWFGGNVIGYTLCVNNGFCYDLNKDDLLKNYGPGIEELIPEKYQEACKYAGHLYGIPPVKDYAITTAAIVIGKEYLDAIGYEYEEDENQEVHSTWDEIEKIYVKLQSKFPDKWVFAVSGNQFAQGSIVDNLGNDWFGVLLDPTKDRTVTNLMESNEWMDMVERMHRWNQMGFISPDALSDKSSSSARIKSGDYMSMLAPSKPGYKSQISGECGREMIVFRLGQSIIKSTGITSVISCLNQSSPDPVAAVQLMNELYTDPELSTLLVWGEEGVDYVTKPDGSIDFPDGVNIQNAEWYHTMNWEMPNQYICPYWTGDSQDLGSRIMEFNANAETSIALGFTFDNSQYTAEYAALQNIYDEYSNQLLYGFLDPVSGTAEFNEKLKQAGLDEYIAEKQRQFDLWLAENDKNY
ncbi:ABC transporter substrate-binding protein [Butyrivibrio sp. INlla16]|uniref:ABC transporter substrate-binding protein n=1 Tax=Butyrivibrio sp. INlla16 TaxID=1520807 RepID=UPI000889CD65|nr:ABC transporter substrate-binding protein [Butyrivibrio sp. INlla16]SDB19946.1 putative aldouronate transport system substrate-binding protein [Butyrivibrio sp. INlla16]